ncbi:MAG: hypothetical protein FJX42_11630, partial [Alphaproteobacteria bacterium]|nr:hypothetical protein [Alphaproteobacteria bacterium]
MLGRFRLRNIFLFSWMASIVAIVLLLGLVFDAVIRHSHESSANDKIRNGVGVLAQNISDIREALIRDSDMIARRAGLISALNFISLYPPENDSAAQIDLELMARQLGNDLLLLDHPIIVAYDDQLRPRAYAHKALGANLAAGYLAR